MVDPVAIPKWMTKVIVGTCGLVSSLAVLGIPWAFYIAGELGSIKTQLVSNSQVNSIMVQHVSERLSTNESEVKELRSRVREIESSVGLRRTTSRPIAD